jgi:type VI protein secretion system component Hcp
MTMRAVHETFIIVAVLTVAVSGQALAGGKGGGGGGGRVSSDSPKGSVSLNYGKIEHSYKPQSDDGTRSSVSASKTGKAHFNEFTIKKTTDKASPSF